ncbi:hypothetical protein DL766_009057 [Monosporascus sp. MC13-8B]|uniref:Uncharacterized protein n=1 Tax=Monosporascus cannonballus TaxID=155416 RepID=A0ABY0H1Z7_9PEZI|nr:hypothetical protein DL762_006456 [Monosporascus cannonballus]RYO88987.1 hypothetical protein DL763_005803 [Monosporascus cannonballus]RYP16697.1 hypothetical protein DL766_009057 [Monosporascus sp. MC13-8B]
MPQALKSYIIAPGSGFSFRRGNSIALGNIFENALEVDEIPISFRDPKTLPPKVHPPAMESNREIIEDQGTKKGIEAWAEYLRTFGGNIGVEQAKSAHVVYNIKNLETDTFTGKGLHEYFEKRVDEEEKLQKYLRKGPIYVVTGIKYSTGITWEIRVGMTSDAHGKLSGQMKEDAQSGGRAWKESNWTSLNKAEVDEEAIFAYQVHRIAYKGWRMSKKRWKSKLNRQGVALGDDSSEEEDDAKIEEEMDVTVGSTLESGLINSFDIEDLAEESEIDVWKTDGEFFHTS